MEPILEAKDVTFSYHSLSGEILALEHISFSVEKGEFLAIVGPSGCGKSTLLSILAGLMPAEAGEILLHGRPDHTSYRPGIGYMLQHDHLFEWRDIYGNVTLGLEIQKKLTAENKEKVLHLIRDYGLEPFLHKRPSELSGGMKQRAALIRTLALEPDILLLDEPFSALDYQTRLTVSADIGKIIRSTGKTAILVTHDLSEAISLADRILVLSRRPARIRAEVPVRLTVKDDSLLAARSAPEFNRYFNQLWKELADDESGTVCEIPSQTS